MREIKFRAWEIKGKGWIAGFNMVNYHGYFNKGLKPSIFRYSTEWEDCDYIIEQFTGLHDNNGKEIYEGDILDCDFPDDDPCPSVVIFDDGCFRYEYPEWDQTLSKPVLNKSIIGLCKVVVIGNIHENPELLVK